jgi:hypothetical protein
MSYLYYLALVELEWFFFLSSFLSINEMTLQAALLVPTTFLKATERIFRSSIVSSSSPASQN